MTVEYFRSNKQLKRYRSKTFKVLTTAKQYCYTEVITLLQGNTFRRKSVESDFVISLQIYRGTLHPQP